MSIPTKNHLLSSTNEPISELLSVKATDPNLTPYKQSALNSTCPQKLIHGSRVTHRHLVSNMTTVPSVLEELAWRLPNEPISKAFNELIYDVSHPNEDELKFRFEYTALSSTEKYQIMMFSDLPILIALLLFLDKKQAYRGGLIMFTTEEILMLTNPRITKNFEPKYQTINDSLLRILNTKVELITSRLSRDHLKLNFIRYQTSEGSPQSLMTFTLVADLDVFHQLLKSIFTYVSSWNSLTGSQRHNLSLDYGESFYDSEFSQETSSMNRKINNIYRAYIRS
ncbi:hypothetical protein ITG09_02915 [Vibrio cyclitrophicus]|nr:hypothetical protein [Vibrio cyclitrophicus]UPR52618.1 hypothetical protein ITG09_02915 [Vibrio cyclitrophicus]